jgi:hypothetical protein
MKLERHYEFTVQVSLKGMIYFNELQKGETMPARIPYIVFGGARTIYAARKIYSNRDASITSPA